MPTTELPSTDMLYLTFEGNWLRECEAKVLSVEEQQVCLDRTVLHAQGGGQPTDVGELRANDVSVPVAKVLLDRSTGIATHFLESPSEALHPGDTITVHVDEARRQELSECHSAGHLVDSAMERCGKLFKPTKGYHFLDGPYVEYEGTIPVEERTPLVEDLQAAFDKLVEEDIPTKIELLPRAQADAICNRQAQNFDMDVFADPRTDEIRVVTVAGYPCPCGGTHVRSTKDLGAWTVTGLKCKKGVVRVKYGKRG